MIKNWEISGAYQDTADYTWHEFTSARAQQTADSIEYAYYRNQPSEGKHKPGSEYKGKFVHLYNADAYAVNAILMGNDGKYNFGNSRSFTVQLNVKLNKGDKNYSYLRPSILSKRQSFNDGEPGWGIYLEGGIWKIGVGQAGKKNYAVDGILINDGGWHTLTAQITWVKGSRVIQTFTDGEFNSNLILPPDYGNLDSKAPLTLGFLPGNINNPADILVSELKIWDRALDHEKIRDMGNLSVSTPTFRQEKHLIGYWPCNEGEGKRLKNYTLNGSDFFINGNYEWLRDTSVIGRALPAPDNPIIYHQENDFIHLNKIVKTNGHDTYSQAGCYAACVINSRIDQDVAFLVGMHDAIKIWVNGKICMRQLGHNLIGKNQYAEKVHLNKGANEVIVKVYNSANSNWGFHLDVSSINYVRKYAIGVDFYSICSDYLINADEKLHLKIKFPSFIPTAHKVSLQILDTKNNPVISRTLASGCHQWTVPIRQLSPGAYNCILTTDADTIEQNIVYGDYQKIFLNYQGQSKINSKEDIQQINTETLCRRFTYLDSFGRKYGFDENLERKIAGVIFDLGAINSRLLAKLEPFKGIPGLHLKGFRSKIDGGVDNYLLVIPKKYNPKKPLPLVIMMPYVTKQAPFIESWHVADIDRIELITNLCNRYGFAAVWPSSRIYKDYNLNPIVSAATFEAINAIKKDYSLDAKKMYLYGDCSGGMEALLIAARYPDLFAAVGVEGPDLSYTKSGSPGYDETFPLPWIKENDIFRMAENYRNIPILIMHTKNDEKADFGLSKNLVDRIKKTGGQVKLDNIGNATKTNKIKMISEGIIISKIFDFYKNKAVKFPGEINFSTSQLKYNKAYWLTVNGISRSQKATVQAEYTGDNTIAIKSSNVDDFTIDLKTFTSLDKYKPLKIVLNRNTHYFTYPANEKITVALNRLYLDKAIKTHDIEGPINDIFSNKFMLVEGSTGDSQMQQANKAALDTFRTNWKSIYFTDCPVVLDTKITNTQIKNYNIILFGSPTSNYLLRKIAPELPLKINKTGILLNHRMYAGKDLSYAMIYPNPLNNKKYVLIIGTNGPRITDKLAKDMSLKGFFDFEVFNNLSGNMVSCGYFGRTWKD